MKRDELTALADELRLLVDEYDTQNSDWSFRKAVIHGVIDRLASRQTEPVAWPKRPFAFAVKRAPENGMDEWRLFMDEGEAREEAAQLDGDYEGLYRVGDRRSVITAPPATDAVREACCYAERLATVLWSKHFKNSVPEWKPLSDDLFGLLTQIDNMTTALTTSAAPTNNRQIFENIIASLHYDGRDIESLTVAELRRAL